jgi:NAD(P)-dependent dehydrogenase (short-subunit alcohol dehydrogenase family)
MKIRNRVVVITGAASGIGRATAKRFAEKGAILHLIDIDRRGVESAAIECGRVGARSAFHVADCRDASAMRAVAAEVLEREALVDVLFLNAGVGYSGSLAETSLDDWHRVLDTNLYGVVHGLDAFLKPMIGQKTGGHVLITASVLGLFALPAMSAYCASKHALIAIAESLRAEVRRHGIEVTAICPGFVASEIVRNGILGSVRLERSAVERFYDRFGASPDEVAKVALSSVEDRIGGIQLAAASGTLFWHLRRYAPGLYTRALSATARFAL